MVDGIASAAQAAQQSVGQDLVIFGDQNAHVSLLCILPDPEGSLLLGPIVESPGPYRIGTDAMMATRALRLVRQQPDSMAGAKSSDDLPSGSPVHLRPQACGSAGRSITSPLYK
jgi:hypothetical protein